MREERLFGGADINTNAQEDEETKKATKTKLKNNEEDDRAEEETKETKKKNRISPLTSRLNVDVNCTKFRRLRCHVPFYRGKVLV